jgi:hypothetical protein
MSDEEYHTARARAELDMAYRAERAEVVEAHLRLSSLHMQRARVADRPGAASLPVTGH